MIQSLLRNIRERGTPEFDVELAQDGWYFVEDPAAFENHRSLEAYVLAISGSTRGAYLALARLTIFVLWFYLAPRYPTHLRRYVVFQVVAGEETGDEVF